VPRCVSKRFIYLFT